MITILKHKVVKYLLIIFVLFQFNSNLYSQDQIYKLDWKISAFQSEKYLTFTNSSLGIDFLPNFKKSFKIGTTNNYKAEILNVKYENLSFEELSLIKGKLIQKFNLISKLVNYRNEKRLEVSFCPIVKVNGTIKKIVEFSLQLKKNQPTRNFNVKRSYTNSSKIKSINNSVLSTGEWYKMQIDSTGVYKITYQDLVDAGINNVKNVKVYGYGGQLSYNNIDESFLNLPETPLIIKKSGQNFQPGDYVIFYAQGADSHELVNVLRDGQYVKFLKHNKHRYSNFSHYFIEINGNNSGSLPENRELENSLETVSYNQFIDIQFIEKELVNPMETGREYLGDLYETTLDYSYSFNINNIVSTKPIRTLVDLYARHSTYSNFEISSNFSSNVDMVKIEGTNLTSQYSDYMKSKKVVLQDAFANTNSLTYTIKYEKNNFSKGWLNFLCVNAYKQLKLDQDFLMFRNIESIESNAIAKYTIENTNANTVVWDITKIDQIKNVSVNSQNGNLSFKIKNDKVYEFCVFDQSAKLKTPKILNQKVPNQNLHNIGNYDMIIVSSDQLSNKANELVEIHNQFNCASCIVVPLSKIYNEFSSGTKDISAIRNFMRYLYNRTNNEDEKPKYLLLFGDGSYNNFDSDENLYSVPTYQTKNSRNLIYSLLPMIIMDYLIIMKAK